MNQGIRPKLPDQRESYTIVGIIMDGKDERYFFQSFSNPESVLTHVSNLSKGPNKVFAIYKMDIYGKTIEMTIGFEDGRLGLIRK